jgi:hypothetical protein
VFIFQDKEEAFFQYQSEISPDPEQVLTELRQAKMDDTPATQPWPLSTHYDSLKKYGGWEKL